MKDIKFLMPKNLKNVGERGHIFSTTNKKLIGKVISYDPLTGMTVATIRNELSGSFNIVINDVSFACDVNIKQ